MVQEKKCPLIGKRKIIPPLCRNISFSIKNYSDSVFLLHLARKEQRERSSKLPASLATR